MGERAEGRVCITLLLSFLTKPRQKSVTYYVTLRMRRQVVLTVNSTE